MTEYVTDRLFVSTRTAPTVYDVDRNIVSPNPSIAMSSLSSGGFVAINNSGTMLALRNSTGRAFLYDNEGVILPQFPTGIAGADARDADFSADGSMISRVSHTYQIAISVYDVATGALIWAPTVGHAVYEARGYGVAFHPSGSHLAFLGFVYSLDGVYTGYAVVILETVTWSVVTYVPCSPNLTVPMLRCPMEFSPDGAFLAVSAISATTGDLCIIRCSDWTEITVNTETSDEPTIRINAVTFNSTGTKLAVAKNASTGGGTLNPVILMDVGGSWPVSNTSGVIAGSQHLTEIDFSPDDSILAASIQNNLAPSLVWLNAPSLSELASTTVPSFYAGSLAYGPAGVPPAPTIFWTDLKGAVEVP